MPIGVSVPLREHTLSVVFIDYTIFRAVASRFIDVVIRRIKNLSAANAPRVIPIQTVVGRSRSNSSTQRIISTFEQSEFFFESAGNLTFEAEAGGIDLRGRTARINRDSWIGRIRVGLIAEERIQIIEITGSEN